MMSTVADVAAHHSPCTDVQNGTNPTTVSKTLTTEGKHDASTTIAEHQLNCDELPDVADLQNQQNDSTNGEDTPMMPTAEFIVSKFYTSKIFSTDSCLLSHDNFTRIAETTFKKNMEFFRKFVWRLQDGEKLSFKKINLVLPECISLRYLGFWQQNYQSFTENIIQHTCQVAQKTDCLVLPAELGIETLHSFICERKFFQTIDVSDAEISISFTNSFTNAHDRSSTEIVKFVSQKLCDIICTFAPADDDHVVAHHPAMIKLRNYYCSEVFDPTAVQTTLKAELESIKMKCDKCNISFNGKQILGAGETQRAVSGSQIETPAAKRRKLSACDQSSSTNYHESQTTSLEQQKPKTLNVIPLNNLSRFTFDSLCGNQLLTGPPHNARLNTAYGYWQLETIHSCTTGAECTIAIIDDGIDICNPAFNQNNILDFQDFSTEHALNGNPYSATSHGTICAGIACGNEFTFLPGLNLDEESSITFPNGVAPGAKMLVYKIAYDIPESGSQMHRALKRILEWHDQQLTCGYPGVDVVSLSLGSSEFVPGIAKVITELVYNDIVIVCAASNEGHKFIQPIDFPARLGHVLCIGSHGPHGKPSDFSPVGQQIDFLAPGEDITAPVNCRHIATDRGTSLATPAVAGLICLILSYIKKHYSPEIVQYFHNHWGMKEILREISTSPRRHSDDRGYGALNPSRFFNQPYCILNSIYPHQITEK